MTDNSRKKDKSIMGLLLILAWLLFVLMAVCFYFFFFKPSRKNTETADKQTTESQTKFSYKTNANVNINALIADYYEALLKCDKEGLKSCVTNPGKFDDMSYYENLSKVIVGYSNINCYSVDGFTDNATLVYVTCNTKIAGIESTPMDIQTFYIIKTDKEYKIFNENYSSEVSEYIDKVQSDEDIQNLYKEVRNNVEDCKLKDEKFKEFLETLKE